MTKSTFRFTTLKQVKEALYLNRDIIGHCPVMFTEPLSEHCPRLYHITVSRLGPKTPDGKLPRRAFILAHRSSWMNGGLERHEVLAWANETLPYPPI